MYCLIAFNTLARPEAILELKVFQIDFENRLIQLNPPGRRQTKKYRPVVPATATLLPWLRTVKNGNIVSYFGREVSSIKTAYRAAAARADLDPDVTPYTIRHTMATELRRRGVTPWEVAGMLGHQTGGYRTTEIYAKYDPDYMSKAVDAIDTYFADLQPLLMRPLVLGATPLRASCVLDLGPRIPQVLEKMVGAAGIEPATPTMSMKFSNWSKLLTWNAFSTIGSTVCPRIAHLYLTLATAASI